MLEYLIKKSSRADDAHPVIIMLHGYGSNEHDLFSFAQYLPEEATVISLQATIPMGGQAYAWYPIHFDAESGKFSDENKAKEAITNIDTFINSFEEHLDIKASKLFLLGFSQGAILSSLLALSNTKIDHVVALSGYFFENLKPEINTNQNVDFFISHGNQDPVIPVEWARKTPAFLNQYQIKSTFKEYPSGHGLNQENFEDMLKWIGERI